MSDDDTLSISRRKLLGSAAAVGSAGALGATGTAALFTEEETIGNVDSPNVLQGGELDLKVDWEVYYYDWVSGTDPLHSTSDDYEEPDEDSEPDEVDQPGPIVDLTDVKPGDVIEHTLSYHVYGNPAFVDLSGQVLADSDNGITEPEDKVNGHEADDSDGTDGGDLGDHLRCLVWYDGDDDEDSATTGESDSPGNNFPDELLPADTDYTKGGRDFIMDLSMGEISFDTGSDAFVFQGSFRELMNQLSSGDGFSLSPGDDVASDFSGTDCFRPSTTHYLGILCWLPWDVPDVVDNIVQTDRLEYQFGLHAEQCRHNTMEKDGECPSCSISTDVSTSPEVSVQSLDASSFPDVNMFLDIDTTAGGNGDLTTDDFALCEGGCGQDISIEFTSEEKPVDFVFLMDVTGSMGGELDTMKSNVQSFTDDVEAEGIDARYALYLFGDEEETGPPAVFLKQDFTADATTFKNAVQNTTLEEEVGYGGDGPEDNYEAILTADTDLSYRTEAQRVMIDITDAPGEEDPDQTIDGLAETRANAVSVLDDYTYIAVSPAPDSISYYDEAHQKDLLADDVGGSWIEIGEDLGPILDEIIDTLATSYRVQYTTANPVEDGSTREVVVQIQDPDAGTLYATESFTAPS